MVRIGGGGAPLGAIIPDGIRGRGLLRTILDHKLFAGGRSGLPQGGITCGAINEPRKSSKAIDERVIINFRDKNVVIARFCDKNVYR